MSQAPRAGAAQLRIHKGEGNSSRTTDLSVKEPSGDQPSSRAGPGRALPPLDRTPQGLSQIRV